MVEDLTRRGLPIHRKQLLQRKTRRCLVLTSHRGVALRGVALNEEYLFRGYVQRMLTRGISFWPTAILVSGAFAYVHTGNNGETAQGIIAVSCYGVLFAFIVFRSGSLWLAVGLHTTFDRGQNILFGVPDSGSVSATRLLAPTFCASGWSTGARPVPK